MIKYWNISDSRHISIIMLKIGIIDSGIGGFSVVKEMINSGINAEYHYVYDNKYHPYGDKNKGELSAIAYKNVNTLILRGVDIIVIACNTLTSSSITELRRMFDLPIIGVEPPIKPCVSCCQNVVVMATPFTLSGDKLQDMIVEYMDQNFYYPELAELALLIEYNYDDREVIYKYLKEKLSGYKKCDGLVLGCTHYNYITDLISDILPDIKIFSSTSGVIRRVMSSIYELGLKLDYEGDIFLIPTDGWIDTEKHYYLTMYLNKKIILDYD